jgi:transketolase
MFAKHNQLDNLTVIIDRNKMQSDGNSSNILDIDMESVWKGFGWNVISCDGHNVGALMEAFEPQESVYPTVVIANTIKGKGISFMENAREWHHSRLNDSLYLQAMKELEEAREV